MTGPDSFKNEHAGADTIMSGKNLHDTSYLQHAVSLINRLSSLPGLDNTAEFFLRMVQEALGGDNLTLYYFMNGVFHSLDVSGTVARQVQLRDLLVKQAFDSRQYVEVSGDRNNAVSTADGATRSLAWAFPLCAGGELVCVLKMEGMSEALREAREQFLPFFNYAALLLKYEIAGPAGLKETCDRLRRETSKLTEQVAACTANLQTATRKLAAEQAERARVQRALWESEQRYRNLFDQSMVGIIVCTRDGRILDANPALLDMVGYREEELRDRKSIDLYDDPHDRTIVIEELEHAGHIVNFPVRLRRKSGATVDVLMNVIMLGSGSEAHLQAMYVDITLLKQAEDALHQSRELLQLVLDTIPQRVYWKDRECRYLGANAAFARDLGLTSSGLVMGREDYDLFRHQDAERYRRDDLAVMSSNAPRLFFEEELELSDGTHRVVQTSKAPLHDQKGQIIGILGAYEDVTEQRRAERALREREESLNFVLEGTQFGTWDWNIETGVIMRNARWAEMLGYTQEEIQTTTAQWTEFVHPDDRDAAWQSINDNLAGKTSLHEMEYRMLARDGSYRWIMDRARVVQRNDQGQAVRMSGTHEDITERKRLMMDMERLATEDSLTGLFNRRYFFSLAETEFARLHRYGRSASVIMLDIDHFKQVNDVHGHLAGDRVLAAIAGCIRDGLRKMDLAGRYGGEEFAVLLPETGLEAAVIVAERLRRSAAKLMTECGPARIGVTVSCGIAGVDGDEILTLEQGLDRADRALYRAKEAGRNRVEVWSREWDHEAGH